VVCRSNGATFEIQKSKMVADDRQCVDPYGPSYTRTAVARNPCVSWAFLFTVVPQIMCSGRGKLICVY